jgi:cobalt-zinc-cadmium efflux system membrane fusion protein
MVASCKQSPPPPHVGVGVLDGGGAHVHIDPSLVDAGRVRTERVERKPLRTPGSFPGDVIADEVGRAEAGTLVSGRVASIEADVGENVKKGQVLAWVDSPEVGRAAAEVVRARARGEVAQRKAARQKDLEAQEATSKNAVDEARADARVAQADLAASRSLLASLGGIEPSPEGEGSPQLYSRVAVRSPIDGAVSSRHAVLGGAVSPDHTLFEVVARGRVAVLARLPESTSQGPAQDSAALVTPRAGDRAPCDATVRGELGPVDPDTRTRVLRLEPKGPCAWLSPGAYVSVAVTLPGSDKGETGLLLPRDAVVEVHGASVVFVVEGDVYVARGVRTRQGLDGSAIVESGLVGGELVVTSGTLLLKGELLRGELQ